MIDSERILDTSSLMHLPTLSNFLVFSGTVFHRNQGRMIDGNEHVNLRSAISFVTLVILSLCLGN